MAIRMQQRQGTADQWLTIDPVLGAGEIGFETDTNSFKIGDGVNSWNTLDYFTNETGIAASLSDYILSTEKAAANGVATLDANGKLSTDQLPSIDEISQDAINTALVGGTGIDKTYDDEANTITLAVDSTIATKTYADTAASTAAAAIVDSAPGTLDTLNELAAALGDDANFATTVTNSIATKADASHTHVISDVTSLQTTLDAKASLTPSVNAKTASYTLTAADKGEVITVTGTRTITVPGSVFSAGDRVDIVNIGTGVITISGSGATILSKDAAVTIDAQYAGATVLFGSPTVAYLIGAIV
jgi:hypothetical protein